VGRLSIPQVFSDSNHDKVGRTALIMKVCFRERISTDVVVYEYGNGNLFESDSQSWNPSIDVMDDLEKVLTRACYIATQRHPILKLQCYKEEGRLRLKTLSTSVVGVAEQKIDLDSESFRGLALSEFFKKSISSIHISIEVEPKIGWSHFLSLYVYAKSADNSFPEDLPVDSGTVVEDLALFMVLRYLQVLASEIRAGLYPGYFEVFDAEIPFLRGNLKALPFAVNIAQGRLGFICDFEEFGLDTPVNRILKEAALRSLETIQLIRARSASNFYDEAINQLVHWLNFEFEEVGDFTERDLEVLLPPHQNSLAASFNLAKEIIQNKDLNLTGTGQQTNELVIDNTHAIMETALIALLRFILSASNNCMVFSMSTTKVGFSDLNRFKLTSAQAPPIPWKRKGWNGTREDKWEFQPDICIHELGSEKGRHVVGDVKYYKPLSEGGSIQDSVKYQCLYFMSVFELKRGLVLNFADAESGGDDGLHVVPPSEAAQGESSSWSELNLDAGVDEGLCLWVVSWNSKNESPSKSFDEFRSAVLFAYKQLISFGETN
jgi:McrBC 5-methylcytosine restriction system component